MEAICENVNGGLTVANMAVVNGGSSWTGDVITSDQLGTTYAYPIAAWNGYPVYIRTDKTKKAIDILKALEADKTLKVASVPKFIALVEKIADLL
jgi:hypothetical protein